jgi:uncharacterized SAM-binding protein YcdF (DUF218 family)/lysophospholipase L1-like esterase
MIGAVIRRLTRHRPFGIGVVVGVVLVSGLRLLINETEFADALVAPLLTEDSIGNADAIVVMGAGVIGDCIPNLSGVRRVIHAVRLWRAQRAPVLLFTGGGVAGACPVAEAMMRLAREFGVPEANVLVETSSLNTLENGEHSAALLRAAGAQRVLVVTDRLHMRRATGSFTRLGFDVQRASVPIYEGHTDNVDMLTRAAREGAAVAYYRVRGWLGPLERSRESHARPQRLTLIAMTEDWKSGPLVIFGASYAGSWNPPAVTGASAVLNRGVSGEQSSDMLARFERDVVSTNARAVVIWGFINDIFRANDPDAAAIRVHDNFVKMVRLARSNGIEPILATEVTIRPSDSWSETIAGLIGWVLGKESYQDRINRHVLSVNASLRQLAAQERLLLLDFHAVTSDKVGRRRPEFIDHDGSHITPAGYAALTAYAMPILEEYFRVR